ncbi:hypothetical protein BTUL_0197g00160 [Botrytis tulipae]|uniref:Uncharacterized protein n=1 Tax=Botrytis tulipae TaxID=87230 RepID=A0A4Z1ED58_9HELO|nr:hypothetical protein BTUL_0197g00160 [Botrytis tulipae]
MPENVANDTTSSQVLHDYGIPNLLYISYVPLISNFDKEKLDSIKADVESWFAFEVGQTESQVNNRMKEMRLPADSTVDSRVQRTMYRAKVIEHLREDGSIWAPRISIDGDTKSLGPTPEDGVYGEVYEELKSHYITQGSLPEEFSFVLKSATLLLASTMDSARLPDYRHLSTNVEYKYDATRETFTPVIKVAGFIVKFQIEEASVTSTVFYRDYQMSFDKEEWNRVKSGAKDFITSGEKILKETSLVLLVNTPSSSAHAIKG